MEATPVAKRPQKALTAKVREEVMWSGPCAYCGGENVTQVDHVIPLSRGGTHDRANLVPACKSCNMDKLDFTVEEWKALREEEGSGWPPKTDFDRLMEIYLEAKERFGR